MPVSSLEATPATRLDELWFEQTMFNKKLAVKIGQLAADTEFLIGDGGTNFLNAHLGLAVDHRCRSAERRPGLSAGHAWRARRRQSKRQDGPAGRRL